MGFLVCRMRPDGFTIVSWSLIRDRKNSPVWSPRAALARAFLPPSRTRLCFGASPRSCSSRTMPTRIVLADPYSSLRYQSYLDTKSQAADARRLSALERRITALEEMLRWLIETAA